MQTTDPQTSPADPASDPAPDPASALAACLAGPAPRATGFIVTIYGDVAGPRGGTLWMGTLIETCALHGISESLVRTAVSRLVTSGRLRGERIGRRSYYRLTPAAQAEFARAARVLYAPPPAPSGWRVALGAGPADAAERAQGWVRLGPETALAPDRDDLWPLEGPVLRGACVAGQGDMAAFAADHWPLAEVAADYAGFVTCFAPAAAVLERGIAPGITPGGAPGIAPGGAQALALRLRLVHAYRHAALADPRLPPEALPPGWPAPQARAVFVRAYLALTHAADAHVSRSFHDSAGLLPEETPETAARIDGLRREVGP